MYHAMYPTQIMVQIMGGQQANVQCPPSQMHALHVHGAAAAAFHRNAYTQYRPDACTQNRHHMIQTGSYPLELLQLMDVKIPALRPVEYIQTNNSSNIGNWQRRLSASNGAPTIPPPHLAFRATNNSNSAKAANWNNNKAGKRNNYRESYLNNEIYNSDSGFSSRSPTPNKHQADGSHTESSDERDSVISSVVDQGMKKLHRIHSNNMEMNITNNRIMQNGVVSAAPTHQFYQNQRPINYYQNAIPTPKTQMQNYQNKRRYHSGRNSPPMLEIHRHKRRPEMPLINHSIFPNYAITSEVKKMPEKLLTGSNWDKLSQAVWSKFISTQQTESIYRNKLKLWRYLYIYIKTAFPKYGLFVVGSTMNGFGLNSSDIDMCLIVRHTEIDQRNEAIMHLSQILRCLQRCDFITRLTLIQAKVPILKFHDSIQKLEVDLNCNNAVGIRNTHLLYCYSQIDWRVKPLVLVVKLWAQSQNINNAKTMTISSYSLVLMVIHFLQCGVKPAVLPCLQSLYKHKFAPDKDIRNINMQEELVIPRSLFTPANQQTLGELFVEFFRYYDSFDFYQHAISVRLAKRIPIDQCRRARSYKNDPSQWKCLCIEEPFDLTNTARSVYDPEIFERIKKLFGVTYQRLKEKQNFGAIFERMDDKL